MTFHVGQRVVCVDDSTWPSQSDGEICPKKGQILTIRAFQESNGSEEGLRFHEIINAPRNYKQGFYECSFNAHRFRPLEEKPERIAIFREIAKGITEGRPIIPDDEKVDHLVHLSEVADLHGFSIHNGNGKSRGFEPKLFQQPLHFIAVGA